jgi:acyl-CoA-dependent ceramide synthase
MAALDAISLSSSAQSAATLHATTADSPSPRLRARPTSRASFSIPKACTHPGKPVWKNKPSERRKSSRRTLPRRLSQRTWALPLLLILGFLSVYATNPTDSNIVRHFLFLSHELDHQPGRYGKGRWDLAFVCFYTFVLSFTREFIMQEVLRPLARLGGIKSRGKQTRFMEQMYTAVYFAFAGPLGLYTMKQTPGLWYFATRGMYEGYPHKTHDAVFKFYYLFQAAYWVQQAVVMLLGQEKPRKDYKELIAHHILTISLIFLSYRFHFTYIGVAVFISHDISDFFLAVSPSPCCPVGTPFTSTQAHPSTTTQEAQRMLRKQVSKSLNYLNHPAQASSFALCIAMWTYLRHYLNLHILYSIATEYSTVGPFELDWETQQYKCRIAQVITFGLLAALQGLNLFWLYCLLRSAYKFVVLGVAKDDRSEAEESEVEGGESEVQEER